MSSPQPRYKDILEAIQEATDLAEIGRIATAVGFYRGRTLGPWFRHVIQGRYGEFTRPGLPDGPRYRRPSILH